MQCAIKQAKSEIHFWPVEYAMNHINSKRDLRPVECAMNQNISEAHVWPVQFAMIQIRSKVYVWQKPCVQCYTCMYMKKTNCS